MQTDVTIHIAELEDGAHASLPSTSTETHNRPMFLWRIDGSVCLVKDSPHGMHIVVSTGEYIVVQLPYTTSSLVLARTKLGENSFPHPSERGRYLP